ncbi:MAG TPA: hypothetical protein VFC19_20250 [Candidatus Limnocylindrales bacterium]|nr:hypothetical protein [Candidatus Limnocylindrales bacterium]
MWTEVRLTPGWVVRWRAALAWFGVDRRTTDLIGHVRRSSRALLTDPLTQWTQWTDHATAPSDPATWLAGVDADGQPVTIRSSGVSGVVVAGLAGYGKTSFLNARFCQLAGSPAVQFEVIHCTPPRRPGGIMRTHLTNEKIQAIPALVRYAS